MNAGSIHVLELRSPVTEENLPRANARLGWRAPLHARELETIARWARARDGASIRLHGDAVAQLDAVLETIPVDALDLDAARILKPPRHGARVRELALHGLPNRFEETLAPFSGVRMLRLDARGGTVDVRALDALPILRACSIAAARLHGCAAFERLRALAAVDLVRSCVDDVDPLLRRRGVVALRLANVERVTSLEALRDHAELRSLALDSLLHLESLQPIATLPRLETLAIGRLWQFNVGDAQFIIGMTGLRALSLDIGGTRKNVEITKPLGLRAPPPFDAGDHCFTTSYESGVQSVPSYLSSVTTKGAADGLLGENGGV